MKLLLLLFFCSCSSLFYQPSNIRYVDPGRFLVNVEEKWFESSDKTLLNSWWMPATIKNSKGTIVYFHGNAQNLSSHFLYLAWITREGYNVFIFDYRGYGSSQGKPNQKGIHQDALAALDFGYELHKKDTSSKRFIIYGQSLGGVISLRALSEWDKSSEVSLIVQDSSFLSYQGIAFEKLKNNFITFLFSPLAFILVSDDYSAEPVLKKLKNPLLVISGKKDHVVPTSLTHKIYKKFESNKKWIWLIENGYHSDVFASHGLIYRKKFLSLLEDEI